MSEGEKENPLTLFEMEKKKNKNKKKKQEAASERFVAKKIDRHIALSVHVLTLSLHPLLSSYFVSMWMENFGKNEH